MISCAAAVRQLWDYLEDEVSARDRESVEEHLAFCRRCCGEVEFAHQLRRVLLAAADVELPAEVEERLGGVLDDLDATASGWPPGAAPFSEADPDSAPDARRNGGPNPATNTRSDGGGGPR